MKNKYFVLSDAMRGKTFAFVATKDDKFYFHPTSELSRVWANEQVANPSNFAANLPPGIMVSSAKHLTPKFEYILENSHTGINEDTKENHINVSEVILDFKHAGTFSLKSSGKSSAKIMDTQIRKFARANRANAVNYKVSSFVSNIKKSSLISSVREQQLRFDKSKSKFVSPIDSVSPVDMTEKSFGRSLERRTGKEINNGNDSEYRRVNRRVKSLYVKEINPSSLSSIEKIAILINRKAKR